MGTPASLTLVLVPGLMCSPRVWEPVLPHLSRHIQTQLVDHAPSSSLVEMAKRVLDQCPARFAVAGHSMGGRVAMEMMRMAPERITHIALIDTAYLPRAAGEAGELERQRRYVLRDLAYSQGVRAMARTWVQDMVHPARLQDKDLIEAIVDMFATKTADTFAGQIEALLARPDASDVLRGLQIPTLLALGRQDNWANLTQHQAMQALAPHASLEVIEEAGHMAPMEKPLTMGESLNRWLAPAL